MNLHHARLFGDSHEKIVEESVKATATAIANGMTRECAFSPEDVGEAVAKGVMATIKVLVPPDLKYIEKIEKEGEPTWPQPLSS